MILQELAPIGKVFFRVITDLNLAKHDVDDDVWRRWAMEAVDYIGGIHRIKPLVNVSLHGEKKLTDIVDYKVSLPAGIVSIEQAYYFPTETTKRSDGVEATLLDDDEDMVLDGSPITYRFEYATRGRMIANIISINRKDGWLLLLGARMPVLFDENGSNPEMYVLNNATYMDAIGWYIKWKLACRDMLRGKQLKGQTANYCAGMWSNMMNKAYGELMMPKTKKEMQKIAEEMSLGVTYMGLNPNRQLADPNSVPAIEKALITRKPSQPLKSKEEEIIDWFEDIDKTRDNHDEWRDKWD